MIGLAVRRLGPRAAAFMFHSIGAGPLPRSNNDLCPHHQPHVFESFLDWLIAEIGARIVSLDEWINPGRDRGPVAALTFDDGCRNHYTTVFPSLRKRNISATFFVPTSLVGTQESLSEAMIREMADNGMIIGSHSVTHTRLTTLTDEQIRWELTASRDYLSEVTKMECEHFCYPFGAVDQRVKEQVREAGFRCAVGALEHNNGFDLLEIPRKLPPMKVNTLAFAASWLGWMPQLRSVRRKLFGMPGTAVSR
jgi:peptidoglycan/xylan/chitin deacetylase (PgdA/CDA1 family)